MQCRASSAGQAVQGRASKQGRASSALGPRDYMEPAPIYFVTYLDTIYWLEVLAVNVGSLAAYHHISTLSLIHDNTPPSNMHCKMNVCFSVCNKRKRNNQLSTHTHTLDIGNHGKEKREYEGTQFYRNLLKTIFKVVPHPLVKIS